MNGVYWSPATEPGDLPPMEFTVTMMGDDEPFFGPFSATRPSTRGLNAAIGFCNEAKGWAYEVVEDGDNEITIRFVGPDSEAGRQIHHHADIWRAELKRWGVRVSRSE